MKIKTLHEAAIALLLARIVIFGATIGDSFAMISLAALYGLDVYLQHIKKPDPTLAMREDIESLKLKVEKLGVTNMLGRR